MAKVGRAGKYIYKATKISPGCDMSIPSDSLEIDVAKPSDLHFGLYEVWSGKWKGGLQILRAVVSPTT
uniref:Uncharacterized protein n=2 Tax=Cajanus cajan TaxID=3821 RepID=A0A151T494_CAJCA|nr:hypothetical protein KK1_016369 [Cajanus cajan]